MPKREKGFRKFAARKYDKITANGDKYGCIQTLVCGAYGWFQQALIRLCVCAAVALFVVLVLRTQTVRNAAARIAAPGTLISVLQGVVMFGMGLATTLSAGVARSISQRPTSFKTKGLSGTTNHPQV